jgi:hypothetical protein
VVAHKSNYSTALGLNIIVLASPSQKPPSAGRIADEPTRPHNHLVDSGGEERKKMLESNCGSAMRLSGSCYALVSTPERATSELLVRAGNVNVRRDARIPDFVKN